MGFFKEKSFGSNLAKNYLNSMLLSEGFAFFMIPNMILKVLSDNHQKALSIKRFLM